MATRACLRCCKLLPEPASFCRRCGAALESAGPPRAFSLSPPLPRSGPPARGGWAAPLLAATVLVLGTAGGLVVNSLPDYGVHRSPCWRSLDKPPAEVRAGDAYAEGAYTEDTGDPALPSVGRRLASARERMSAAAERLEAARQRFDARSTSPAPQSWPSPALRETRRESWQGVNRKRDVWDGESRGDESRDRAIRDGTAAGRDETSLSAGSDLAGGAAPHAGAPQITGLSAPRGPAGKRIGIRGRGFTGTSRVLFATAGAGIHGDAGVAARRADAWFRLRDDGYLVAVVPDLGPDECDVVVAVFTPRGAAVTVPKGAVSISPEAEMDDTRERGFSFVGAGASLFAEPGIALFVDRGANVQSPAGSVVFVRRGGGVERARTNCLIVRETDSPQPRDLSVTPVLDVPALNASRVEAMFQYSGDGR